MQQALHSHFASSAHSRGLVMRQDLSGAVPHGQCVAVDMRGYNLSDKPVGRAAYCIDVITEDVAALVGALSHERCDRCSF